MRATLRAFYRRAAHLVSNPVPNSLIYVEIGPAYVLATAKLASLPEKPTRFAIESRAWPALRPLLKWEETTTEEARARGAQLRKLYNGSRFGRHLFITYQSLSAILYVAEELVGDTEDASASGTMELEAMVELTRRPLPGLRTVAARCPRRVQHSNGDRKPSLMLWMNPDGVTGGALCPVCHDLSSRESPPRNMTWRVHYLSGNTAALYTPRRRIRSPVHVEHVMNDYYRRQSDTEEDEDVPLTRRDLSEFRENSSQKQPRLVGDKKRRGAVGGCVMKSKRKLGKIGEVIGMAYVTASLRMKDDLNTTSETSIEYKDGTRLRTIGTMARQSCPMRVLLWSDRRSKGPLSTKRIEDLLACAKGSFSLPQFGIAERDTLLEPLSSDGWLSTPLVSVSAMKPSGWRDVIGQNGRVVSLPASWEAAAQAWVLFDIDDIKQVELAAAVTQVANKIALTVRRDKELSGRCLVLQTGPTGLHVWAELREVRENPRVWFKKAETRTWYSELGKKILQAAHRGGAGGGKVDMSSCSAGRFARRPGWRLLEDGSSFRSHVVIYVPSAVRNRKPRSY